MTPAPRYALLAPLALALLAWSPPPASSLEISPEMKKLAAAADQEGTLALMFGEGALGGSDGARLFERQMNTAYGTHIKVVFTPGPLDAGHGQPDRDAGRCGPAGADRHFRRLVAPYGGPRQIQALLFLAADWQKLLPGRLDGRIVEQEGRIPQGRHQRARRVLQYQAGALRAHHHGGFPEAGMEGKIASTPYAANFDVLAADDVGAGEGDRLCAQAVGPARRVDALRRGPAHHLRRIPRSGAQLLRPHGGDGDRSAAPIANLVPHDFLVANYSYVAVPRNAPHPNAGTLFAAFTMTPEGQDIIWRSWGSDLDLFPRSARAQAGRRASRPPTASSSSIPTPPSR